MRSKLISPPTNFNHLVHVGPTDGKPSPRDLSPVSTLAPITNLGEAEQITGFSSGALAVFSSPGTRVVSTSGLVAGRSSFVMLRGAAESRPLLTVPQQAPEAKGRGVRSSVPQRPHSFSEASRRPASTSSDGKADSSKDSPTASCPQVSALFGPLEYDLGFLSPHPFLEQ